MKGGAPGSGVVVRLAREVVAVVGGHVITRRLFDGWMREQAGEAFYLSAGRKMPERLVGEPANVPGCVASLRAFAPSSRRRRAQLVRMCGELYREVKRGTLEYLVSSYWAIDFAGAHGIAISEREAQQALQKLKTERYPRAGEFERVLASRTRTPSQELFLVKNNLVSSKLVPKLLTGGAPTPLGNEALRDAATGMCPTGYVVEHCKSYSPSTTASVGPSPRVLMEEIASWNPQGHT
jgi:hypothetical protein